MKAKKVPYNALQRLVIAAGENPEISWVISFVIFIATVLPGNFAVVRLLIETFSETTFVIVGLLTFGLLIFSLRLMDRALVIRSREWRTSQLLLRVVDSKVVDYGEAIWKRGPGEVIKIAPPFKEMRRVWNNIKEEMGNTMAVLSIEAEFEITNDFDPQELYDNFRRDNFRTLHDCLESRLANILSKFKDRLACLCKGEISEQKMLEEMTTIFKITPVTFALSHGFSNLENVRMKLHVLRSVEAAV